MNKKLSHQAITYLKRMQGTSDKEAAHIIADDVLCELLRALGYDDVVDEWEKVEKRYA